MTITDLGKVGPHPDLIATLVRQVGDAVAHGLPAELGDVTGSEPQPLQQRTLYDVQWSMWSPDGTITKSGTLDVSAGLVVSAVHGGRKQLIGYAATRFPDRQHWGVAQTSNAWIEDPPKQPWIGCFLASHGIWVGIGGLAHSPALGRVRIALADGQAVESKVSNGSFLVLVPFDSPDLWSSPITVAYHETEGREIRSDSYGLSLASTGL